MSRAVLLVFHLLTQLTDTIGFFPARMRLRTSFLALARDAAFSVSQCLLNGDGHEVGQPRPKRTLVGIRPADSAAQARPHRAKLWKCRPSDIGVGPPGEGFAW